jgi:hypothetical protein
MYNKYIVEFTIHNMDSIEDSKNDNGEFISIFEYEYESEYTAFNLMEKLKEELYSKEPVSGDNTYDITIEVKSKNPKFIDFGIGGLSMISDSMNDIHSLIDSVMY